QLHDSTGAAAANSTAAVVDAVGLRPTRAQIHGDAALADLRLDAAAQLAAGARVHAQEHLRRRKAPQELRERRRAAVHGDVLLRRPIEAGAGPFEIADVIAVDERIDQASRLLHERSELLRVLLRADDRPRQ